MTIIGLVRHGETDWNVERRAQGHTDIPLNAAGSRQAQLLAGRLGQEPWDVVYSSDLSRAYHTARAIAERLGVEVVQDARLREVYLGRIEGTTEEERIRQWGEQWRELDHGEETREALADRGAAAIHEYASRHPDQRILVVSHGGLLVSTIRRLIPSWDVSNHLGNTAVTIVRHAGPSAWDCELYNCQLHLNSDE